MINKITLNNIASFKRPISLETDKKINLIYGLNGTGKSTFSNYLYNNDDDKYSSCSIEGLTDEDILVYNQKFIQEYFYTSDELQGIFTLSKQNKEAEEKIKKAEEKIKGLEEKEKIKREYLQTLERNFTEKKQYAENITWKIKTSFTGGDRVLEYCLEGLKREKAKLFEYIQKINKPEIEPQKTTDELKKEIQAIHGDEARKYDELPKIGFVGNNIETNEILKKEIVGNQNSTVATLIYKLKNSDWVKKGIEYLPSKIEKEKKELCPFCQQPTITQSFINEIKSFFDKSYEEDLEKLKSLLTEYKNNKEKILFKKDYLNNPFVLEVESKFNKEYEYLMTVSTKLCKHKFIYQFYHQK